MLWFCSDWALFIYIRSSFFVVAFIKKKDPAIIIYKVHYLSGNDAKKGLLEICRKEWLLGLHAERSTVLRITFWDGFPHIHVLTFFETGSSLKKKIDPDPDSEFY